MKKLFLAECRSTGIPLRSAHVPLQITVADGGEDGRISWSGGADQTAYLPSRFNVFQSKAQKLTEALVSKEILKTPKGKGKSKSGAAAVLSDAVGDAIAQGGSYVVFCNEPMVGAKRDKLVKAMRKAVADGGGDHAKLAAIEVYDANLIADWVTSHPAVALWLASKEAGRSLYGFRTHQEWGAAPEIANVPWQEDDDPRFDLAPPPLAPSGANVSSGWTVPDAVEAVRGHLALDGAVARVAGPSGYGKSRFAYEAFTDSSGRLADEVGSGDVIYVDGAVSADDVLGLALGMVRERASAVLVVDDCGDELHGKLAQIVRRAGSRLRLLTIDTETSVTIGDDAFLYVQVRRAADGLIQAIAKGVSPGLSGADAAFIASLAAGFPRMAVLAAEQGADGRRALRSIEQVIARVVWGTRAETPDAQHALEIASLFGWFGIEGDRKGDVEWIASHATNMTNAEFVAHVLSFVPRGVVERRGDFVQVGPIPLAARLGARRLAVMSSEALVELYTAAPPSLGASLLARMKWLDASPTAARFADVLLRPEALGNLAALGTGAGAECLNRLLQVNPDAAAAAIARVFAPLTIDELAAIRAARRQLVWSLEALVFRTSTFEPAATLLRRLAAVEPERYVNSATGCFKGLFRLYLSGTEVPPSERLLVLDEGLASEDVRERRLCVEALGTMVETSHFTRFGGADQIGSAKPSRDWEPANGDEAIAFLSEAISRLSRLVEGGGESAARATAILAGALRGLLDVVPFAIVEAAVGTLASSEDGRVGALRGLAAWLYFDRRPGEDDLGPKVRTLFGQTLPTDKLALMRVYTSGWPNDLHDPDKSYADLVDRGDHDYATRHSRAVAREISGDDDLSRAAAEVLATSSDHAAGPFADELMRRCAEPKSIFRAAVEAVERSDLAPNVGLFAGLIQGAEGRGRELARDLVVAALRSPRLKGYASRLINAGAMGTGEIAMVVELLRDGTLTPTGTESLSYGRGLAGLSDAELKPLFDELEGRGGEGLWAILGIMQMILYGGKRPSHDQLGLLTRVLTRPELTRTIRGGSDGSCLDDMVKKVAEARPSGKMVVRAIARNLLDICRPGATEAFHHLSGSVRQALSTLAEHHPVVVWGEMMRKAENASSIVRYFAKRLLLGAVKEDSFGHGIDVAIASSVYLAWVREKPEARASKAVAWLPIAYKPGGQELEWHPQLSEFLDEFATYPGVLDALRQRLFPSLVMGSMVLHLELLLQLAETWRMHRLPSVRAFAVDLRHRLREDIAAERKREEERSIHFG